MSEMLVSEALSIEAWRWFGVGLGAAFVITIMLIVLLFLHSAYYYQSEDDTIDLGFLGLIVLLVTIFYMIAFSFLVAASTKGVDIKVLVAAVDAFVVMGGKLLAPNFLRYLNDEAIGGGAQPRTTVWIYLNETTKSADDKDYVKVFATEEDAERWVEGRELEGEAFEYLVKRVPRPSPSSAEDTTAGESKCAVSASEGDISADKGSPALIAVDDQIKQTARVEK